jgi:hypothetical protein
MARSKAERSAVRGKRVPLLIMIVHPKPMGRSVSSSQTRSVKNPSKSNR